MKHEIDQKMHIHIDKKRAIHQKQTQIGCCECDIHNHLVEFAVSDLFFSERLFKGKRGYSSA